MATITPGSAATLTALTAEGQLWQWLQWVQRAENMPAVNTTGINNVTGSKDLDSGIFSGNWALPCVLQLQTDGSQRIIAEDYLPGLIFSAGDPAGTFKSSSWASYGLEIIEHIIAIQILKAIRQPPITASFNANTRMYSGAFRLPFEIDSNLQDVAKEFV